ncbi:diacylglycerol/polyprenol kinase family protein [Nanoarchaeota archaeon]
MAKILNLEFRRQVLHIFFGLAIVFSVEWGLIGLLELWIIFLIGLLLSIASMKYRIPIIADFLDYFERDKEKGKFPGQGPLFYVLGSLLALALFERNVALASIIILALGDSISHLVGRFYGRIKHPLNSSKFAEGAVVGVIFATIGAWLYVPLTYALVGSVFGMVAEGFEVKYGWAQVDDNLIIPIVSGVAMVLVSFVV